MFILFSTSCRVCLFVVQRQSREWMCVCVCEWHFRLLWLSLHIIFVPNRVYVCIATVSHYLLSRDSLKASAVLITSTYACNSKRLAVTFRLWFNMANLNADCTSSVPCSNIAPERKDENRKKRISLVSGVASKWKCDFWNFRSARTNKKSGQQLCGYVVRTTFYVWPQWWSTTYERNSLWWALEWKYSHTAIDRMGHLIFPRRNVKCHGCAQ